MAEFKFVQWGKGVPLDYQRLNAMMLNDQYLKDKVESDPRGILLWKNTGSYAYSTGGTPFITRNLTGFVDLAFNCEADRLLKFTFFGTEITNVVYNNMLSFLILDGVSYNGSTTSTQTTPSTGGHFPSFTYIHPTALSAGAHKVGINVQAYANTTFGGSITLLVEDIGAHRAESA